MKVQGSVSVAEVKAEDLWKMISNVDEISRCFPGLKNIQKVGENSYKVTGQVSVGLIKGDYTADVNFTKIDETTRTISFTAKGRGMNSVVDLVATLTLNSGELKYDADVRVSGVLASLASRAITTVVDKIVNELIECAKSRAKVG